MDLLNLTTQVAQVRDPQERVWSPMQTAIFDAAEQTSEPLICQAVAGSGKTTTLIQIAKLSGTGTVYLAFAKANALDLQSKLEDPKMAKTINSMGHGIWLRRNPGARFDLEKMDKICSRIMELEARKRFGWIVKRVCETAKNSGFGLDDGFQEKDFAEILTGADQFDIDDQDVPEVAGYCYRAFLESISDLQTFDYSDQVYGPIFHQWGFPSVGTLLVDEVQDLNTLQHLFVGQLVARGARLIAVGDRNQSIFAFRGALHDSMDQMKQRFAMTEFPLSVSYRCPQAVIREAQELVPHIQARDGAPAGRVADQAALWAAGEPQEGRVPEDRGPAKDPDLFGQDGQEWLIVCRNNAPLFAQVMKHVRARRPCRVLSNALEGLKSFVQRLKPLSIEDLETKVQKWMERELLAAEAKGMPWKAAQISDKGGTVLELAASCDTPADVIAVIRQLSESKSGPLFSTIHKAKGLEADHVYFLRPDLLPSWWIKRPEDLQQEQNLRYVAITRAKQSLTYGVKQERRR